MQITTKKVENAVAGKSEAAGIKIDPDRIYTATEVCDTLGITRRHLGYIRRVKSFPLAAIGGGRVIGAQILEWLRAQAAA